MRKKWAGYTVVFSLCMSLFAPAGHSRAEDLNVRVTLPDFAVNLNGHTVENQYREYPLLVYHDITYFPMTWYDSRMLGLEANWAPNDGLNIKQSPVTSSYVPYTSEKRNATAYTAEAPASTVTINGKTIDNTKEKYPLLSFRDVTYFPLTWRFAHDEFGWDYQWDETNGLSITSHNSQVQTAGLPEYAEENDVALFKGYYYFVETTGTSNHVYRAPVQQPSDKEEIYTYNFGTTDRMPRVVSFQIRDNTLWFTYHLGGGVTGSDEFVKISDDGKAELMLSGYLDFRDTPDGTLIVLYGASAYERGNLYLLPPGQDEMNRKRIGDSSVLYGCHVTYSGDVEEVANAFSTSVIGDDVYVLASHGQSDLNKIYKINLKTYKSDKIIDTSVSSFRVIDNKLYYVKDEDNVLYSSTLDGTGEMKLSDHAVSWFDSIDGNVFYTTKKEANRFELYQADPKGKDPLVWKTLVTGVQVLNDRLVCRFGENDDYGVVLLDGSGRLLLSVADPISRVLTSDDPILLASSNPIVKIAEIPKINVNQIDEYINLTANTEVYKMASKGSKLLATIAPQSVHVFEKMNNWYHIRSSWLGDSWIYVDDKNTAPTNSNEYHAPTFVPLSNIDGKWTFEHQYDNVGFNIAYSIGNNVAPNLTYPRYSGEGVKIGEPLALNLSLINRATDSVETVIRHDFEIQIFSHDGLVWRGKVPSTTNIPLKTLATMGIDFQWNQKDSDGNPVPAGQYSVYLLTPANIEYTVEGKEGIFTEHIDKVADKTLGGYFTIQ